MRLIFTNCYKYNPPEHDVVAMARKLQVNYAEVIAMAKKLKVNNDLAKNSGCIMFHQTFHAKLSKLPKIFTTK